MHKHNNNKFNKHQQLHTTHLGVTTCESDLRVAIVSHSVAVYVVNLRILLAQQHNHTVPQSSWSTSTSSGDPTTVTLTKSFTNSKPLTLRHSFVSNKVVGPDRFRYIGYYWTTPNTPRGVDVGTSSGVGIGFGGGTAQPPNVKQEVDTNEGQKTLAIQLQYQGVLPLAGVTAGLKLPAGFRASNPLTDDPN